MFRTVTCKTGEICTSYQMYLKSNHWQDVRNRYYASKYPYKCNICEVKTGLQLHHKSYKRIGNERLNDLVYLCGIHHKQLHDTLKVSASNKTTLWNINRKMRKKKEKST